ncbi:hypothetical protein BOW53_06925 [Solemya pervernicosa gill symbiont]|uniref:DUF4389 domain-containing protein n=2 Tax=Gammaproteobacteria incertae sedis TaxID=118884 RepID=A0A1T2L6C1_9GAMM|nr:DUF4389 domain-containing protein [Candidatus Reidiella endopervernicosa]OOZ40655.1 hypothetical protein BOW53_06925 [Solemya pervernicosa gill symbiont]QKQ27410.1 DUF4389 domain-containing protein [Candidatus Reidiella endopervernicosa]
MDNEKTTQNGRGSIGRRALYMVLFALFYSVAELVLVAVVMIQFLIVLFGAESNRRLLLFGAELGRYIYQIIRFLTFNSEQHVYPLW